MQLFHLPVLPVPHHIVRHLRCDLQVFQGLAQKAFLIISAHVTEKAKLVVD